MLIKIKQNNVNWVNDLDKICYQTKSLNYVFYTKIQHVQTLTSEKQLKGAYSLNGDPTWLKYGGADNTGLIN